MTATNEVATWASFLVVGADQTRGQLHSTRPTADSVWSTSYKTERMVLGGWGSVNLDHLFTRHLPKFGCS